MQEFIELLKLLEKRPAIRSVEVIIGELPEGRIGKKFARLSDGVTKRKYVIGKVNMIDGRECSLIEVEENGEWSNEVIQKIEKEDVIIIRNKHTRKNKYQKANYIYEYSCNKEF